MHPPDLVYELKPYAILAIGVYSLSSSNPNPIAIGIGLTLLGYAAWILRLRFRARKGTGIEAIFYECQPFIYLGLALYAFTAKNKSVIGIGSAVLLIFCALVILNWRLRSRG